MKRVFLLLIMFAGINVSGQPFLGTWTSYLPYNKASIIAVSESRVYCSTNGGLFYYNKNDNSLNKFSKENGLSDSDISAMAYSKEIGCLIIAYKNANLDILMNNRIINLPDIMRKQIPGDKGIYSIFFHEKYAYLSCGFGIVIVNLDRIEISDTYFIGEGGASVKVNTIAIFNDYLYAGTDNGLYYAELDNPNLIDFNNWMKDPVIGSTGDVIKTLSANENHLYLSYHHHNATEDSIIFTDGNGWQTYPFFQNSRISYLELVDDGLLVCSFFEVDIFNNEGDNIRHTYTGSPKMAKLDDDNDLWIADFLNGMIAYPFSGYPSPLIPGGPSGIEIFDLEYSDGKLLGVAGGATFSWNNVFRNGAIYSYENKKWENWKNDTIKDIIKIKADPQDKEHYFASSWGYGLLEFRNSELENIYRESNSTLQSIIDGEDFIRLGGLSFDRSGNLWVTNSGVAEPLSVLTPDGEWHSFNLFSKINSDKQTEILITAYDHKWIVLPGGDGLFVFNDQGTLENQDDDEYKKLSIVDKNNDIISNEVYSIAEDLDGNIWVGTIKGPIVYYSPYRVFDDNNFYAQQIIIPRNDGSGLGDPLLGTESITCITVDGANRKWLGTRDGGVFLVSEDGLEQIHEFNTANSPLLSNSIVDIVIAEETGEVFIATERGIISFIGDATTADDIFRDVYIFPNPVRENYLNDIVVSGLVADSYVKITDLNGNLVNEGRSLGGQYIWDGKNYQGERVATGIYLVFCASPDGMQTFVTKLMFIH